MKNLLDKPTKHDRHIKQLFDHLVDTGRTLAEEHAFVLEKKSNLSRAQRELVCSEMERIRIENESKFVEVKKPKVGKTRMKQVIVDDLKKKTKS